MATHHDVESHLVRMGVSFDSVGEGTWVIHAEEEHVGQIVVRHDPPILVFRCKIMDLPRAGDSAGLMRKLLELNASGMLGAAYGLEGQSVVAVEVIQSDNLDANEFDAAVDGMMLSIGEHMPLLTQYVDRGPGAPAGRRGSA
ncbi:MAG: hypothetical protein HY904_26065 [Deltaproteobacteria bacterium]|nr:hypothetical protein [Deltaproteobacteria bacterium]